MNPNNLPFGFNDFWKAYPRRVAKGEAVKAYMQVGGHEVLPDILKNLKTRVWPDDPKFIPHPATFLRGWRWLDEEDSYSEANDIERGAV